ncbi:hypothetical protein ACN9M1_13895 [Ralstonia sp. R-29]|uniref:hypothetical protein n=1 Tax=Ralstonia sp. R-29 TaxID=3404059 RepID=UPI003CEB585E
MNLARILRISIAMLVVGVVLSGCGEKWPPTQVAVVKLQPERYGEFVSAMDAAMQQHGLTKFPPAPGLDDLMKRPVLFYLYKRDPSDTKLFLTVTDVEGISKVKVDVFGQYFPDAEARQNATASVHQVVEKFGGTVVSGKF